MTRSSVNGGPYEMLGRTTLAMESGAHKLACAGDRVFLGTREGVAMFHAGKVKLLGRENGLPDDRVMHIDAGDDAVILTVQNAILRLDPRTEQFVSLASSRSLKKKNKLDGSDSVSVTSLVYDRPSKRFIMHLHLAGSWYYDPATDEFERLAGTNPAYVHYLIEVGGRAMAFYKNHAYVYDGDRNQFEVLPDLAKMNRWSPSVGIYLAYSEGLIFGEYVMGRCTRSDSQGLLALNGPDQKEYLHPKSAGRWNRSYQLGDVGLFIYSRPGGMIGTVRRKQ